MAAKTAPSNQQTTIETRRVFLRAERGDQLRVIDVIEEIDDEEIPTELTLVRRQMTYYGPKLRVEGEDEQYLLTSPGPDSQALLWHLEEFDWTRTAEVRVEFSGELPQYDICPACGEPISTMAHERRSLLGTCDK